MKVRKEEHGEVCLLDNKNLVKTFNKGRGEEKKRIYNSQYFRNILSCNNVQPLQKHPNKTEMFTHNVQSNGFLQ